MSVSYFVRYRGSADDPAAFADYYRHRHAAILADFPGLRGLILHRPVAALDPFPTRPGGSFFLAQMTFDSADDLTRALASEARARARADFANFPHFDGEVTHEAMAQEIVR
jgi:uncharacterized protein (TIGR02118 family)